MKLTKIAVALGASLAFFTASAAHAWEPTKPVEFVVPAGTGGGAGQMAGFLQELGVHA